ncbi:MAG: DNA repair protein RecN [Rhodospirillales bacterium]
MLASLSIRNVVLIEKLDLAFGAGLCVLTGETGAGKSILLDSLGLALGLRAESGLVRRGAEQASVTAEFDITDDHPAMAILRENDLPDDLPLMLRRVVGADGRSRAYINDQAAGVRLLRQVGDALAEVHGQFEQYGLMNPANHLGLLDSFAGHGALVTATARAWRAWQAALKALRAAEDEARTAKADEDYLRHALAELDKLAVEAGEEEELGKRRQVLMHGEKIVENLNAAFAELNHDRGIDYRLRSALRAVERARDQAGPALDPVLEGLAQAADACADATMALERASAEVELDPAALEAVEERLFALRAAARKHSVAVEELPLLRTRMAERLGAIDAGDERLGELAIAADAARKRYAEEAGALQQSRRAAAGRLDEAVNGELGPLKFDRASFHTALDALDEGQWNESGMDRAAFLVATNPGAEPGPLGKIASGGELSRFMLALKVSLAETDGIGTLIFDEVDSGVGGAVADAVGERHARLSDKVQVMVVTHSPQVAARGAWHLKVAKTDHAAGTVTSVARLSDAEREEEIARMLAGANVTEAARAAASSLLSGAAS